MMGGTMRAPLTAMIFALELTGDLNAAAGAAHRLRGGRCRDGLLLRRSILTEKVARRGHHLMREYSVDPLNPARRRRDGSRTSPIPATMPFPELSDRIAHRDPKLTRGGRASPSLTRMGGWLASSRGATFCARSRRTVTATHQ